MQILKYAWICCVAYYMYSYWCNKLDIQPVNTKVSPPHYRVCTPLCVRNFAHMLGVSKPQTILKCLENYKFIKIPRRFMLVSSGQSDIRNKQKI